MSLPRTFVRRSVAVLLLAAGSAGLLAWTSARPAAAAPANDAISQAMEQMQESVKALSKGISADSRTAALEQLGKFQAAILAAKTQTPDTAAKVDEKKRDDF